ncbi:MAG: glycosyltransferase family 2 protein [Bacteroidetes bacterium]|jgi:glycosyltransferase involved in cell wall biosynthesis|nr:glycosyltransferase family 2 protein [Bacteroidota bacterium]
MQSLSVSIITFNEEKNIARCLDSVKDIANEIVVIDSLSSDNTENICKQYGVKFFSQKFLGYIEQKNFALDHCKHNYVLCLDADECLSKELIESIKIAKQNNFSNDSYTMNRCSNFCGKWIKYGNWYPDRKLRLFNKQKGKWGGVNPHDKIEMQQGCSTTLLKGDLLHYSYYTIEEVLTQNNKFTTIQAKAMLLQGKRSNVFKLFINPFVAFVNGYVFKLGFLNGVDGFFIASTVAYHTMIKYYKLLKLQNS